MNPLSASSCLSLIALAGALLLGSAGCQGPASPGGASSPSTGAPQIGDCTPRPPTLADQAGESDPRVLRGQVQAPFGKLAAYRPPAPPVRSPFPDWLVDRAYGAPLEVERTIPNTPVYLYQVDARGERAGEYIAETRTDSGGNWCIRLPEGVAPAPGLMVEARGAGGQARLRRSVVAPFATDTSVGNEALTRLLQANQVDFVRTAAETLINMESIADTRMDLLDPVELRPTMTLEQAVARVQETLATDPRLAEKMASAPRTP